MEGDRGFVGDCYLLASEIFRQDFFGLIFPGPRAPGPGAPEVGLRPTPEKIGGPQARIFGRVGLIRHMSPTHAHKLTNQLNLK
jgi:hypothetical protein